MTSAARRGPELDDTLGHFLQSQANAAGLSTRDIAERFEKLAAQEKASIEDGGDTPADPVSRMSFSKSHLDRLYRDSSSPPSKRFLRIFLGITSRAAGVPPEQHRELCQKAEDLLSSARRNRLSRRAAGPASPKQVPAETVVATLQIQLELERAQRTEDRLRWALSDTQALMGILLQIINALRDIITDIDTQVVRGLRTAEEPDVRDSAKQQRSQAQTYKRTAEAQFDRVNHRRRLLEILWDQAHGNLQRLAVHAEVADIPSLPDDLTLPPQMVLPEDFHSQTALVDIATALGKVEEHNDAEEQATRELQHTIMADEPLQPDDELAILVAATRLTDDRTRGTALRTLVKNWPQHPDTRDTLVRLAQDEERDIRLTTAWHLAEFWAGDDTARDAIIGLTRDSEADVQENAILGLAERWASDDTARDAIIGLTHDDRGYSREAAVLGLVEGWAGDDTARDALVSLVDDDDVNVRVAVAESLANSWPGNAVARTALHAMNRDASSTVRWAAQQGIVEHDDPGSFNPRGTGPSSSILLAVRIPPLHSAPEPPGPIPLFTRLRQGIDFDTGVTVLLGKNGAGKTVLLHALALLSPRSISDAPLRNISSVSRQLAIDMEAVWNELRPLKGVYYLTHFHFERRQNQRASAMENWMEQWSSIVNERKGPNRLFLLDEPTAHLDRQAHRVMAEQLEDLVTQGCQVIIASAQHTWAEIPTARVIRMEKRTLRKHHVNA
ncbi:HEAT repeat domain-containing protein [Streptomyces sp. NPDC001073]